MVELYKIRPEQIATMRWELLRSQRELFVARLQQRLPHRAEKLALEQLHHLCDFAIDKANGYEMTSIESVYVFVAATLILGRDFDLARNHEPVDAIFGEPFLEEDERASMLIEYVRAVAKEEIVIGDA